ncbi:ADP ribosylation factor [Salpingoeca rosetta]|uniref:ADP ribosylation factor n=1 Tax=Salpingoeca rosetta (strain ATCC 50818 / BSB-021) TaxID=946362 RepID=F2UAI7_SALR5|nr:ADP ribosylation factor [Salpingoeca rosetta]EGD73403.1 ADP ribosylation factor [Salpingoeca rosetta]|eukprot:XP_004993685.1 ADP ribosylation factor [Salpingoeca rosetta]
MGGIAAKLGYTQPEVKVVMLGLDAAGKTSLLYRMKLNENITPIPTIGFNVESIPNDTVELTLWDVGLRSAARKMAHLYIATTDALVFVVDATDRERLDEAVEMLVDECLPSLNTQAPILVLANKQDIKGALSPAWLGRLAVDFLSNYSRPEPFFLKVSFHRPHSPYDPPQRVINQVQSRGLPPLYVGDTWDDIYADDLENCGPQLADADDHGDGQSDHRHWRKGFPYFFSARVPFLFRWPDGVNFPRLHATVHGTLLMADTEMKYIFHAFDATEQLFNISADPHELHDLSGDPAYQLELALWRGRMVAQFEREGRGSNWVVNSTLLQRTHGQVYSPNFPPGPTALPKTRVVTDRNGVMYVDKCRANDVSQMFSVDNRTIIHLASGLCVTALSTSAFQGPAPIVNAYCVPGSTQQQFLIGASGRTCANWFDSLCITVDARYPDTTSRWWSLPQQPKRKQRKQQQQQQQWGERRQEEEGQQRKQRQWGHVASSP